MMNAPLKMMSIGDVVRGAYEKTKDREKAVKVAMDTIYSDKALYKTLCDDLLHAAISERVSWECHRIRAAAWNSNQADVARDVAEKARQSYLSALEAKRTILMEYPLSKGLLRDYTGPMLDDEADLYRANARTLMRNEFWLRSIRMALPDDIQKVGEVLDEQALRALQDKAGAQ